MNKPSEETIQALRAFAEYIDYNYGTTYLDDNNNTLTTDELLSEWIKKDEEHGE